MGDIWSFKIEYVFSDEQWQTMAGSELTLILGCHGERLFFSYAATGLIVRLNCNIAKFDRGPTCWQHAFFSLSKSSDWFSPSLPFCHCCVDSLALAMAAWPLGSFSVDLLQRLCWDMHNDPLWDLGMSICWSLIGTYLLMCNSKNTWLVQSAALPA